ncbi:MAG: DUF2807 domain-containing protein [Crocinitomicaceae bacterium]
MVKILGTLLVLIVCFACKKVDERSCWKTVGNPTSLIIPIDSVQRMVLNSGLTYIMHQSDKRQIEVVGGENMVKLVEVENNNFQLVVSNKSSCNFLRNFDKKVTIHVYYPEFIDVYAEVSDSLIFADTIKGNLMQLEMREAGGVAVMTTDLNDLRVTVSAGPGHFVAKGFAKFATLKTQGQGYGDGLSLKSQFLFGYQNSRATLKLNLDDAVANIGIDGAGDILYSGSPKSIELTLKGEGKFIKY